MADFDFAQAAEKLAQAAVCGERGGLAEVAAPFVKQADGLMDALRDPQVQRYLLGGLGGGALGAALGAAQPDKEKRKRNMLYYGAFGGLGGLGLAHLAGSAVPAAPAGNGSSAAEVAARNDKHKADVDKITTEEYVKHAPGIAEKAVGGLLGGVAGNRLVGRPVASGIGVLQRKVDKTLADWRMRSLQQQTGRYQSTRKTNENQFQKTLAGVDQTNADALLAARQQGQKGISALQALGMDPAVARQQLKERLAALTAQHRAQVDSLRGSHNSAQEALRSQAALAHARTGSRSFGRRPIRRGLGWLGNAAQVVIPAATTYLGGAKAPEAITNYFYGE